MNIPYRTRRKLQRLGVIASILALVLVLVWLCWIVWLERYVVYTRDGAIIDFSLDPHLSVGQVAQPPSNEGSVEIFYNEGSNSTDASNELKQLRGYYIDREALANDLESCKAKLGTLPAGTPIMIDMKNVDGTFNYSSALMDATMNSTVDIVEVDDFIDDLTAGKFYAIARISAFRDYQYGLNHTSMGLSHKDWGMGFLWKDEGGCYWLDPTNPATLSWVLAVIEEVKAMGFNEIVLDEFRIPEHNKIIFNKDRNEALVKAMNTILERCAEENLVISFAVSNPAFPLPEGSRTRIYLNGVSAERVGATAAQVAFEDPTIQLVFVTTANDTRFEEYSVLRPIASSDVLEGMD